MPIFQADLAHHKRLEQEVLARKAKARNATAVKPTTIAALLQMQTRSKHGEEVTRLSFKKTAKDASGFLLCVHNIRLFHCKECKIPLKITIADVSVPLQSKVGSENSPSLRSSSAGPKTAASSKSSAAAAAAASAAAPLRSAPSPPVVVPFAAPALPAPTPPPSAGAKRVRASIHPFSFCTSIPCLYNFAGAKSSRCRSLPACPCCFRRWGCRLNVYSCSFIAPIKRARASRALGKKCL